MKSTHEAIEDQYTTLKHIKRLSTTFASKPKILIWYQLSIKIKIIDFNISKFEFNEPDQSNQCEVLLIKIN